MTKEQAAALLKSVKAMRHLQKEYFKNRDKRVLEASKAMEKEVDQFIADYERQQTTLDL